MLEDGANGEERYGTRGVESGEGPGEVLVDKAITASKYDQLAFAHCLFVLLSSSMGFKKKHLCQDIEEVGYLCLPRFKLFCFFFFIHR